MDGDAEYFSLTWNCESRQRDTTSSGWKFKLDNLAVTELTLAQHVRRRPIPDKQYSCLFGMPNQLLLYFLTTTWHILNTMHRI